MTITVEGDTYYTMQEFSEVTGRSYSYIRKCVRGLQRAKDISEHVIYIEDKPFISESALSEFDST